MSKISKKVWVGIVLVALVLVLGLTTFILKPDWFNSKADTFVGLSPVLITVNKTTVKVGDTIHYTVAVTNNLKKVGTVRGSLHTIFPTGTQHIDKVVNVPNLKVGETRRFTYDIKMVDYKANPSYPAAIFIPMCPMGALCMPGNDVNRLKITMIK